MWWMSREGPSFFSLKSWEATCFPRRLLQTQQLLGPTSLLFFYPSDSIPARVHHGYASPEANIHSYQMLSQSKIQTWGKVAARLWMGAKVLPHPQILSPPPERAGTKLYFCIEETKCI